MRSKFGLLAVLATVSVAAFAQPPQDPVARKTWRAENRAKANDPKVVATRRALRMKQRAEMIEQQPPAKVKLVEPRSLDVQSLGGAPVGGNCPAGESCTLRPEIAADEIVVVTALWSATSIECDGVKAAAPRSGAVVSPYWRCKSLAISGESAGWLGYRLSRPTD